jgi:flagellar hook-length control protein FliK
MTSSSAFNSVLLKSPVQPQAPTVPKRDYQNDSSSASGFQQALKDVRDTSLRQNDLHDKDARVEHARAQNNRNQDVRDSAARDSARRHDEKLAKANSQKTTQADNRKQTNDASTQKKSADDAAQPEQNLATDNTCAKDKATAKSANTKQIKKTDNTDDATNASAATNAVVLPGETELSADLTIATAGMQADETSLKSESTLDLIAANLTNNKSEEGTDSFLTTQTAASELIGDKVQGSVDSTLQLAGTQSAGDLASEQAKLTAESQSAEQNPAILTATSAINSASTSLPTDAAADVLASLTADLVGAEKSASKSVTADASPEVAAEPEAAPATTQLADQKSTFEKMLQSVARSGVIKPDESVSGNTSTANNPNNANQSNATDSLLRMSDAQTPAARSFVVQTGVPVPFGQPKWSEAVGEKVLWLAAQNVTSAEINLHPKDLGPVQVKVSVNQEQASVSFTSHHAVVREVLDQNLNRLRDMFNEQGLNLVNVDVSDKSFSRQQDEAKDQKSQNGTKGLIEDEAPVAISAIMQQRLVDHYA